MKCREKTQKIKNKIKQSVKSYPKNSHLGNKFVKNPVTHNPSNPKIPQKHAEEPLKAHPLGNSYEKKTKRNSNREFSDNQ